MSERLEAFTPEIEVSTHNGEVVAVTYEGRLLTFSADETNTGEAAQYRGLYENGDAQDVLAVEVDDE